MKLHFNTIPLFGKTFGRLTVEDVSHKRTGSSVHWKCKCSCGRNVEVSGASLRGEHTKSCGCLRKDFSVMKFTTHGQSNSPTHKTWMSMNRRCTNPTHQAYKYYGGKGVKVCKRWKSFKNFLQDMGERPLGKTIDRFPKTDGNYEPGNCRWATVMQQRSRTTASRLITYKGKTFHLNEWARITGIKRETIARRLNVGWSVYKTFRTPVKSPHLLTFTGSWQDSLVQRPKEEGK